jgi:quercetin dioxygenase-like cupin family protein
MPNTAAEPIRVGALTVRFHVDSDESGGSVSVFECDVPANARMPAPHSHDEFDETVFGLDGVTTSHAPSSWPDSRTTGLTG